jgi:CheY-like chemotaxis protein
MRKSIHIFPSVVEQPLVNFVFALREMLGLAPVFSNSSSKNTRRKTNLNPNHFVEKDLQVWFIDDDPINNMLNRSLMEEYFPGINVVVFQDARVALSDLGNGEKHSPDVIFLDLNMPGFNGWDFMDVYCSSGYSSKVFILTSSIDPKDRDVAGESNRVAGFYSKPLMPEMIQEALNKKP